MAGKLLQVNKAVADGTSSSLSVTGIDTDDIYVVYGYNIFPTTSTATTYTRVTKSGTQDSTANYDFSFYYSANLYKVNQSQAEGLFAMTNATGKYISFIANLHSFNSSTEYSFYSQESNIGTNNYCIGGVVHKSASSSDGFGIFPNAGNVGSGSTLVLYKVL